MNKRFWFGVSFTAVQLGSSLSWSASGADALLRSTTGAPAVDSTGAAAGASIAAPSEYRLTDPFVTQFFALWQTERQLPFEVNAWATQLFKQNHAAAAHLWGSVDKVLPASFRAAAEAAQVYTLYKLGLAQTAFDAWVKKVPELADSRLGLALDQVMGTDLDRWLTDHTILVSPEQSAELSKLDPKKSQVNATIRGWIAMRKGESALEILPLLPNSNRLKLPLAQTVALALAKKGDLGGAAKVLKLHAEPAIEANQELNALSGHLLQIARFLFQVGALEESEQYYQKVPNTAPEFMQAREELTWILLRKGDKTRLRGEVATLSSKLFEEQFQPELYVVRAVSNLKLCYYGAVEKDFKEFQRINLPWVKRIDQAVQAAEPPVPLAEDAFSKLASRRLANLEAEAGQLEALHKDSIQAALPAVGFQEHWMRAKQSIQASIELAKKLRASEYRRQWRNQQAVLGEAIRKMQFVKVELLNQMREVARLAPAAGVQAAAGGTDQIRTSSAAALQGESDKIGFPVDGVMWPDELFKLRSVAEGRCLAVQGANSGGNP